MTFRAGVAGPLGMVWPGRPSSRPVTSRLDSRRSPNRLESLWEGFLSTLPRKTAEGVSLPFWPRFVELLRARVENAHYETWLARLLCRERGNDQVDLVAPNTFMQDWIKSHYLDQIRIAADRVDGRRRRVRILHRGNLDPGEADRLRTVAQHQRGDSSVTVIPIAPNPDRGDRHEGGSKGDGPGAPRLDGYNPVSTRFFETNSDFVLNDAFTFQQFVTGSCNELACASARAVAEFPGGRYNPLFIHGCSGLGKTHLLQAVCHAVLKSPKPRRVLYLSCENFVNQFIQAVTNGDLEAFRYRYRKVDLLLIDDVQFLEGKTRTQEEFFHTFNTLYNAQRQIVLSSDRPPRGIATLQDRLVSRFRWGMVTKIEPPCLETRVAILKRKARLRDVELSSDVAQCLAEHIDTNIRELEGAVTRVIGYANLVGRAIGIDTVHEALRDLLPSRPQVTVQAVIELVSNEFGVLPKELQSKRRIKSVVLPRQVGIYLARTLTRMSLEEIGGFFGGRDHSTVLHSIRKIDRLRGEDEALSARIARVSAQLERA